MAGESDPKGVKPELDAYFAQFSVDDLRVRESSMRAKLAGIAEGAERGELKQVRRALGRVQRTIAAKLQGASGVPVGEAVSRSETPARPTTGAHSTALPVAQQARHGGGVREAVRGAVGRAVDALRGGGREHVEPVRRGPDPAAAVIRNAADVRAAAPGTSPAVIAASPSVTPGGGSSYAQKQAGGGGRGPTGVWGIEAEVLGDEEESAA